MAIIGDDDLREHLARIHHPFGPREHELAIDRHQDPFRIAEQSCVVLASRTRTPNRHQ
jgi:hypothetical protein